MPTKRKRTPSIFNSRKSSANSKLRDHRGVFLPSQPAEDDEHSNESVDEEMSEINSEKTPIVTGKQIGRAHV